MNRLTVAEVFREMKCGRLKYLKRFIPLDGSSDSFSERIVDTGLSPKGFCTDDYRRGSC